MGFATSQVKFYESDAQDLYCERRREADGNEKDMEPFKTVRPRIEP